MWWVRDGGRRPNPKAPRTQVWVSCLRLISERNIGCSLLSFRRKATEFKRVLRSAVIPRAEEIGPMGSHGPSDARSSG